MRLLLIRHGATVENAAHRLIGHTNPPLSEVGRRQSLALGQTLSARSLAEIVTSDLRRATETANEIARHHSLVPRIDPDLRELAMGAWEGYTTDEIQASDPAAWTRWQDDPLRNSCPGGETLEQLRFRIVRALAVCELSSNADDTILWVTHGGVIAVLLCHVLGMELHRWRQFRCVNASLSAVDFRPRQPVLRQFNSEQYVQEVGARLTDVS